MRSNSFRFVLVSLRRSLCFGAKPSQRTEDKISCETGSGGPRVDRESQSKTESRREQSSWVSSPGEGRSAEEGNERRQRWVSIPSGFLEVSHKIHAHDSHQMHEQLHKSITQPSISCAWSWPRFVFVSLFFFFTLSVVLCVSVKKCVIPLVGNHWTNHWPWEVWFNDIDIVGVGRPGVISHRYFAHICMLAIFSH